MQKSLHSPPLLAVFTITISRQPKPQFATLSPRLAQTYQPLSTLLNLAPLDRFSVSYHNLVAQAFFARATYTTRPHLNSAIPAIVVEIKVT